MYYGMYRYDKEFNNEQYVQLGQQLMYPMSGEYMQFQYNCPLQRSYTNSYYSQYDHSAVCPYDCPLNMYQTNTQYFNNYFTGSAYPSKDAQYVSYRSYRQIDSDCQDAALVNAVADYSEKKFEPEHPDHQGAFPNFEQGGSASALTYQVVLFYKKSADFYHAPISEFGNIDRSNFEAMMIAADNVATNKGRRAGFPTFHKGPNDYGMFLFKNEAVDIDYLSLAQLGNPRNVRDIFVAINRNARQRGYESGFPTFTKHSQGRYKVVLLKNEYGELRGVASRDLNLPKYYASFCTTPPPPSPVKKYPLRGEKETNLGRGHRVKTEVTISNNGRVDVLSIFTSNNEVLGFHANAQIILTDNEGNVIDSFEHRGNADGKITGNNRKEFRLEGKLLPEDLKRVEKVVIRHSRDPIPQITKEEIIIIAEKLAESQAEGQ